MPLRDHFHAPWSDQHPWEGFHSAWANTIVRHLNGSILPPRYRAVPQIHLGAWVESDVAALEQDEPLPERPERKAAAEGQATALWAPPEPVQTMAVEFPDQDVFEVQVLEEKRGLRLVAVIEFVSPGNKDRAETRRAFTSKCAAYLQQHVGVLIVDIVSERGGNLHQELLELLSLPVPEAEYPDLYAVSFRTLRRNSHWQLDTWPRVLIVDSPLPILPLWLASTFAVPIQLEETYEETCKVLRIS